MGRELWKPKRRSRTLKHTTVVLVIKKAPRGSDKPIVLELVKNYGHPAFQKIISRWAVDEIVDER